MIGIGLLSCFALFVIVEIAINSSIRYLEQRR